MRRTPSDISEYLQIIARRKWWFTATFVLVNVLVIAVSVVLPRYYDSEAMILVDPQKLPPDYVKATVGTNVGDRLETLTQEIMSRTRLVKIIDQLGLYKKESKEMTQEDVVELMRKDIKIEPIMQKSAEERTPSLTGFKISYESRDPQTAQQVTRQLSSLFVEENLKIREQEAQGTDDFLQTQLEKASKDLGDQEAKLKAFKVKYNGALPEQEQANLGLLAQVNGLLQSNADAINRLQQQKTYLQSMQQTDGKIRSIQPVVKTQAQLRLEAAQNELDADEGIYQPTYPDILRLKNDVRVLQAQVDQEAKTLAAEKKSGQVVDSTALQLKMIDDEIKQRTKRQAQIEAQVSALQSRVSMAPALEEEWDKVSRDYSVSKANYDQLLAKKGSASEAVDMEHSAKGEQFRILDPASLPEKASKPDLFRVNLVGLGAALALAVGMVLLVESKDAVVQNTKDIEFYAPAPLLGSLPEIATEQTERAGRFRMLKTVAAMGFAFSVWLLSWAYLLVTTKIYKQLIGA